MSLIDKTIASIECTPNEATTARQQLYSQHQITGEAERKAWLNHYGITNEQLEALAVRELKIEKFKAAKFDLVLTKNLRFRHLKIP